MAIEWWLSFADAKGHRGAVIVPAVSFAEAIFLVTARGLNPGGEVVGRLVPDLSSITLAERELHARLPRLTLLQRADFEAAGIELMDWA